MQALVTVIHAVVENAKKMANTALMPMLYPSTRLRPSQSMMSVATMFPGRLAAATMNESSYGLKWKLTCQHHHPTYGHDTTHTPVTRKPQAQLHRTSNTQEHTFLKRLGIHKIRPYQPKERENHTTINKIVVQRMLG